MTHRPIKYDVEIKFTYFDICLGASKTVEDICTKALVSSDDDSLYRVDLIYQFADDLSHYKSKFYTKVSQIEVTYISTPEAKN